VNRAPESERQTVDDGDADLEEFRMGTDVNAFLSDSVTFSETAEIFDARYSSTAEKVPAMSSSASSGIWE
jgi:hypothetical protein